MPNAKNEILGNHDFGGFITDCDFTLCFRGDGNDSFIEICVWTRPVNHVSITIALKHQRVVQA